MHAYMYSCIHVRICTYIETYAYIYIYTHTCIYMHTHTCMSYIHACMHAYIHITYIYIHTYLYIHIREREGGERERERVVSATGYILNHEMLAVPMVAGKLAVSFWTHSPLQRSQLFLPEPRSNMEMFCATYKHYTLKEPRLR